MNISGWFVPVCSLTGCVFAAEECPGPWALGLCSLRGNSCVPLRMNYCIHSNTEPCVLMFYSTEGYKAATEAVCTSAVLLIWSWVCGFCEGGG